MVNPSAPAKNLLFLMAIFFISSCGKDSPPAEEETWVEIGGLASPLGIAKDSRGRVWVTEAGSGQDDGKLTLISLKGEKKTVLSGLPSVISNGNVEGLSRPYIKGNALYFVHGISGTIYKLRSDVASIEEPSLPLSLNDFESWDIGAFSRALPTSADENSNVMDLYEADNGDLFILDAGANALLKRENRTGSLSLFAEFPKIATPAPFPVSEDAVPTGLVFDGTRFLVSTLSGVPFNTGVSKVFSVSSSGQVTEFGDSFTNLVDIEFDQDKKPVMLQYAEFSLETGFQNNTGAVLNGSGSTLVSSINQPIDLLLKRGSTFYLLSYGDGILKKIEL